MDTPRVSIIMAAFNHAQYIDKAIASALAQTWQDFELIVVDDGSTDATGQVVSQFGSPVRYIYQQNRGQGGARNRGIASARGEFVCFLDDDDLWEPEYLATVISVFQRQPDTDALYTGFRIIDGEDRLLPQIGGMLYHPIRCMTHSSMAAGFRRWWSQCAKPASTKSVHWMNRCAAMTIGTSGFVSPEATFFGESQRRWPAIVFMRAACLLTCSI